MSAETGERAIFETWSGGSEGTRDTTLPELDAGEVHLWSVELRADADRIASLGDLLDAEERRRSARYRFDRHRRRFIVAQGTLRLLLAGYAGLEPEALGFAFGKKGKPSLLEDPDLHFNLSHSHERAVVALTREGPLGVDIERHREMRDADDIARRFFSEPEVTAYESVPAEQRRRAFFDCWTRKEAFVKALGEGLFVSLDRFAVSLAPGEPARLLQIEGDETAAEAWTLASFEPAEGFAGALAMRWRPAGIRAWRWEG